MVIQIDEIPCICISIIDMITNKIQFFFYILEGPREQVLVKRLSLRVV